MNDSDKTKEELIRELTTLQQENNFLKVSYDKYMSRHKQMEEEFKESEKYFKLLITNIRDVVYSVDVNTKEFKYLSPSFERITGYSHEDIKEMGGRMVFLTKVVTESKFKEWDNHLQQLKEGKPDTDFKHETWWLCKNGNYKCLQDHWIPIYANGELVSTDGVLIDITERKQAEQEIKLINEKLLKLNTEKDKFFSIIAHDLRSPFNSFLGLTKIMVEELPTLELDELQKIAVMMENSAAGLFRLLENLLQWARMQQGLIHFNREIIKLLPVVDESIGIMLESARIKGIEIVYDIPDELEVFADSNILQTVIRNLVSNAVKFTPKGGNIRLSAKVLGDKSIEISIRDSGIGMSCAMIDNLFQLDIQTNREGTEGEPSTGLGLILCRDFIEKHGGKIWVESEEGKGSVFYFTLPSNTEPEEKIKVIL